MQRYRPRKTRPKDGATSIDGQLSTVEPPSLGERTPSLSPRALPAVRYVAGVLLLAGAYYGAGQASFALQYSGPVTAIWLPVGVGAAALYLAGLRWLPG